MRSCFQGAPWWLGRVSIGKLRTQVWSQNPSLKSSMWSLLAILALGRHRQVGPSFQASQLNLVGWAPTKERPHLKNNVGSIPEEGCLGWPQFATGTCTNICVYLHIHKTSHQVLWQFCQFIVSGPSTSYSRPCVLPGQLAVWLSPVLPVSWLYGSHPCSWSVGWMALTHAPGRLV